MTMTVERATDIVARQFMANVADHIEWEDIPNIGEFDYERIVERIREIAQPWIVNDFDAAITMLEKRAEGVEA